MNKKTPFNNFTLRFYNKELEKKYKSWDKTL